MKWKITLRDYNFNDVWVRYSDANNDLYGALSEVEAPLTDVASITKQIKVGHIIELFDSSNKRVGSIIADIVSNKEAASCWPQIKWEQEQVDLRNRGL